MNFREWVNRLFDKRGLDTGSGGIPMVRTIFGYDSAAGVNVTPERALTNNVVMACIKVLSESVAGLPLFIYENTGAGRRRAPEHYLYKLLHDAPNPEMTAFEFRESLMANLLLFGNGYAELELDRAGRVTALWPLRSDSIEIRRINGNLVYDVTLPDGSTAALDRWRIFHIRGLATSGYYGLSPIRQARESIGLSVAAESYGAKYFGNGARPGIVLKHPGKLGDEGRRNLKDSWNANHSGLDNSHRVAILEEGMSIDTIGVPPEESQFLETRRYQVEDIARIFRVPLHMINELNHATFSNIEHQQIEFVTHALRPWLVRFEQAISRDLLTAPERGRFYAEHLIDGLLRGDTLSRYQAYNVAINSGWLTRNEARIRENLEPITGLDAPLMPLNMIPVGEESDQDIEPDPESDLEPEPAARQLRSWPDPLELRGRRAANERHRLVGVFRPVILDAAKRVVKREYQDISAAGRKMLLARDSSRFLDWLADFYIEHRNYAEKQLAPGLESYAEMISASASLELGGAKMDPGQLRAFVRAYIRAAAEREGAINESALRAALDRARATGKNELEALEEALRLLESDAPDRIATTESTRANNAVARAAYLAMGVTLIRWVSFGDSCPYCAELDGRVIDIERNFLDAGQELNPDGAGALKPGADIGHPPVHGGCDCMIIAGAL